MAYQLLPRDGSELSAVEVARLLAAEFAYTNVDAEQGAQRARDYADWIERAPARIFLGQHATALKAAKRLRSLAHGEAASIEFGNDVDSSLQLTVIPGEPLSFGFPSNEEQERAKPLLERCARALNCELVLV